jgi:hypothetical protein
VVVSKWFKQLWSKGRLGEAASVQSDQASRETSGELDSSTADQSATAPQLMKVDLFSQWLEDNFDCAEKDMVMSAARSALYFNEMFSKEGHFPYARLALLEAAAALPNAAHMRIGLGRPVQTARFADWRANMRKIYGNDIYGKPPSK